MHHLIRYFGDLRHATCLSPDSCRGHARGYMKDFLICMWGCGATVQRRKGGGSEPEPWPCRHGRKGPHNPLSPHRHQYLNFSPSPKDRPSARHPRPLTLRSTRMARDLQNASNARNATRPLPSETLVEVSNQFQSLL